VGSHFVAILQLVPVKPRLADLLEHEVARPFQWNTRFGHFWFRAYRLLTIVIAFLALPAFFYLSGDAIVELVQHHYSSG
jgi:hypothetical protein